MTFIVDTTVLVCNIKFLRRSKLEEEWALKPNQILRWKKTDDIKGMLAI